MKAAFSVLALLATLALASCRASSGPARNTIPDHRPLTEATTPETAEPSRRDRLALPDTIRRDVPPKP